MKPIISVLTAVVVRLKTMTHLRPNRSASAPPIRPPKMLGTDHNMNRIPTSVIPTPNLLVM
ncbi:MAG: hypothetical protein NTU91_09645 [Chloroflexi bacterium]|nr:hypothetical protein [Chloroflexota bacterium]